MKEKLRTVKVTIYGKFQITRDYDISGEWSEEDLLQRVRDDEFHQNFPLEETDWEIEEVK